MNEALVGLAGDKWGLRPRHEFEHRASLAGSWPWVRNPLRARPLLFLPFGHRRNVRLEFDDRRDVALEVSDVERSSAGRRR